MATMDELQDLLRTVKTVLVIDWPAKEVPIALAQAGFQAIARGGAGPEGFSAYELQGTEVVPRRTGRAPDHADLVYSYRPLSELPGIAKTASGLHAKAIWVQSGLRAEGVKDPRGCWLPDAGRRAAQEMVEAAGMRFFSEPYIVDVLRTASLR